MKTLKILLFTFFLHLFFIGSSQSCLEADSIELVKIYNACSTNWTNKWDLNAPVKTWQGIYLSANGCSVDSIVFPPSFQSANKVFPSVNLPDLKLLDLSERSGGAGLMLAGIADVSMLVNLERLDLAFNQLTAIPDLSALSKLKELNLSENNFTTVPDLTGLSELETLYLKYSQLAEAPDFSELTKLQELDLSGNYISTFIDVTPLGNLEKLSIQQNGLIDTYPKLIGLNALVKIRDLNILGIKLDTFPDFSTLDSLLYLTISCRDLETTPDLSDLSNLNALSFYSGNLETPPNLSVLSNLDNLSFYCDSLEIAPDLSALSNLRSLSFYSGNLESAPDLSDLSNLNYLYFNCENLEIAPDFSALNNLDHLNFSGYQLTSPPDLTAMTNLRVLRYRTANLAPPNLSPLTNLKHLYFQSADFDYLPDLSTLVNLERLDFSYNNLSAVPDLSMLTNLTSLNLNNNRLNFSELLPFKDQALYTIDSQWPFYLEQDTPSTLSFSVGGDLADNTYTWYKDDILHTSIEGDSTLTITEPGTYYCVATNRQIPGLALSAEPFSLCGMAATEQQHFISGNQAVCVGFSNPQLESYTPTFLNPITPGTVQWEIIPSDAFPSGAGSQVDSVLTIDFSNPNPTYTTVSLRATAQSDCGMEVLELVVQLDTQCVWPGHVDLSSQSFPDETMNWIGNMSAFNIALAKATQLNANATLVPEIRPLGMAQNHYDWLPQHCPDWQLDSGNGLEPANFFTNSTAINFKHADCNGDGVLTYSPNWTPNTPFELASDPSDSDYIAYQAHQNAEHDGNTTSAKNQDLSQFLNLVEVNKDLGGGYVHVATIYFGNDSTQIDDVNQVLFKMETVIPQYDIGFIDVSSSHLSTDTTNLANYLFRKGGQAKDSVDWYVSIKSNDLLSSKNFNGQELCRIICRITVAPKEAAKSQYTPTILNIPVAGYVYADEMAYTSSNLLTFNQSVLFNAKVLLEGAFCSDSCIGNIMTDKLRTKQLIPAREPYSALGYSFPQPELVGLRMTDSSAVLSVTGAGAIVDWVLVEVRNTTDSSLVSSYPALLQRSGQVVDVDGASPLPIPIAHGEYFIGVQHRNHLPVMTTNAVLLTNKPIAINFLQQADYQTEVAPSIWALRSGDMDKNLDINGDDKTIWSGQNGKSMLYHKADFNLDGDVGGDDKVFLGKNFGHNSVFPK